MPQRLVRGVGAGRAGAAGIDEQARALARAAFQHARTAARAARLLESADDGARRAEAALPVP